jgi:hypothetical protein
MGAGNPLRANRLPTAGGSWSGDAWRHDHVSIARSGHLHTEGRIILLRAQGSCSAMKVANCADRHRRCQGGLDR